MTKNKIIPTLAFFGALVAANATVTINVQTSGWGDASAAANDLFWGIIVDTDGAGTGGDFGGTFLADMGGALFGYTLPSVSGGGAFASGISVFDEYELVAARGLTEGGGPPTFGVGAMNDLGLNLSGNISSGNDYGLIWFSTGVTTLGTSDTFGFQDFGNLPSDGATISVGGTPGLASNAITAVPEPSTFAALAGLCALGAVMVRRRRA
jgi:hypothetical protein